MNHMTAREGGGGGISLTPHYHFTPASTRFTDTYTLSERLLQRAHLCIYVAPGLQLGTFGSQANH